MNTVYCTFEYTTFYCHLFVCVTGDQLRFLFIHKWSIKYKQINDVRCQKTLFKKYNCISVFFPIDKSCSFDFGKMKQL